MDDFILRALIAGISVALVAGPLGCFVVWRRMAYFGDTLAHSALFGIALGLLLDVNLQLAVIVACVGLACLLALLEKNRALATDTILGILAHGALAFGLITLSFSGARVDLISYLFGDLLTVSRTDLAWITGGSLLALTFLGAFWNRLLAITLHQELARVEGMDTGKYNLALMILMALVVAVSMKIIGVLLITALLIIPPASARPFARSPEIMAAAAALIGCLAVAGGMAGSYFWDTPTGPSIVAAAAIIFVLSAFLPTRE